MNFNIRVCCGLGDTKRGIYPSISLPNSFIPRVGDTLVLPGQGLYWQVKDVVIDYDNGEILVWLKDSSI